MKGNPESALLVSLLAVLASWGCAPGENQSPANVVVILIDDMGWMDTSVYGSNFYETPNIDRLAAEDADLVFKITYKLAQGMSLRLDNELSKRLPLAGD